MGRYYFNKKQEADGLMTISVKLLKKFGFLSCDFSTGALRWTNDWLNASASIVVSLRGIDKYLKIMYTQTKDDIKKHFNYRISIVTTPCHFGGSRYWFICPAFKNNKPCVRRVGVLYKDGDYFACRHCNNVTYNSRNLSGIFKTAGQTICEPDLEKMRQEIKREYYNGKMTRKYRRYLEKNRKAFHQIQIISERFGG